MSQAVLPYRHPLLRAVDAIGAALDDVADNTPTYMTVEEKEELLLALDRQTRRLEALQAKVVAAGDDVALEHGARSAGGWLAHRTQQDSAAGRRVQRLATGLDQRWPVLAAAYSAGAVSTAQVRVIGKALDQLPADLDPELRVRAEEHLVAEAERFPPRDLAILGRRVLDVVAPEVAEDHEAKLLQREEAAAYEQASLHVWKSGPGQTTIQARVPDATAARLMTLLHAFTSPRHEAMTGNGAPDDRRPYPTRLGHAFMSLVEKIPSGWVPKHGSSNTTFVVTMTLEDLTKRLAAAGLGVDGPITAGDARRMACNAGILPAVLGGTSQVLDLGRSQRLFNSHQHTALALRHPTCQTEGCDVPAAWCEAHHVDPWSTGGRTDLDRGELHCSFHHHKIHDPRYRSERLPDGQVRFHRRT